MQDQQLTALLLIHFECTTHCLQTQIFLSTPKFIKVCSFMTSWQLFCLFVCLLVFVFPRLSLLSPMICLSVILFLSAHCLVWINISALVRFTIGQTSQLLVSPFFTLSSSHCTHVGMHAEVPCVFGTLSTAVLIPCCCCSVFCYHYSTTSYLPIIYCLLTLECSSEVFLLALIILNFYHSVWLTLKRYLFVY